MKNFLNKPRSILGATLWGAIGALTTFLLLLLADLAISLYTSNFGSARQVGAIAVGGGYSISLFAAPAHPWLAEYNQSVRVYGGEPRVGKLLGEIEIPMNTGGRVRIGILVPKSPGQRIVGLVDRNDTSWIDLDTLKILPDQKSAFDLTTGSPERVINWDTARYRPLGWVSGESYPLKFIPCQVWPRLSEQERDLIVATNDVISTFCDEPNL